MEFNFPSTLLTEKSSALADKITQYLLLHPFDLLDTHRLMTRFQASPAIVQQALQQLEMATNRQERPAALLEGFDGPTKKLIFSLLRHPHNLVDSHRLMRRFSVSSTQFQQALDWIAQRVIDGEEMWSAESRAFE
jgi:response regulator of citrate/malate metabolism